MRFQLYATFRLIAGQKVFTLDLPAGTTVRQAVHALVEHCPALRPHWLDEKGEIHAHVHIFVNGHDISTLEQGEDLPLQPEDVLDFFPPVAGGQTMKRVIVLAMHGAPPLDFPPGELREFFGLHAQMDHAGSPQRAGLAERYAELERKLRSWPRTEENDPFYAGARALANALQRAAGCSVILGFNEFCAPSLDEALDQAAAEGAELVVVITPMMTRGGEHSEHEIPRAVEQAARRNPGVTYRYAWPLELEAVAELLAGQARRFL